MEWLEADRPASPLVDEQGGALKESAIRINHPLAIGNRVRRKNRIDQSSHGLRTRIKIFSSAFTVKGPRGYLVLKPLSLG